MDKAFNRELTATYRLQFHKDFTFADAAPRARYFRDLGISHVYASPIMQAKPGSMHGYDVTDFAVINPELGGEAGFRALAAALREVGLGLIVDIVPNHMAIGADNPYWVDLLAKGRNSAYADFFDVDFDAPGLDGKILLPFLGGGYRETLEKRELKLQARAGGAGYEIAYFDNAFPVRDADAGAIRAEGVAAFADPARLHALLEAQPYRLAGWRTANDLVNFRRFFEITSLAGVRIERACAFDQVHRIPLALYAEGLIDGVRVDHVDGLTDPAGYCRTLRAALRAETDKRPEGRRFEPYVVVEKILGFDEPMPEWDVDGTTGYDFMNEVSALQHESAGARALRRFWGKTSGRPVDFEEEERVARSELVGRNFAGQLDALAASLHRCCLELSGDRDLTLAAVRRAAIAVIGHLRVYRSYALGGPDNPGAGEALARAFAAAEVEPSRDDDALRWLKAVINSASPAPHFAEAIRRFHQLTAPVAAKSVEDTAFYRYGVLISRNDVGFNAGMLALSDADFHARMAARARDWPHAMLTTATHDHKRGEDVRARLAVLSELPERWKEQARAWSEMNAALRADGFDGADEYMLFQTLVGAWPPGLAPDDAAGLASFADRLAGWQQKALREAKLRTSWLTPNADYERRAERYLRAALDPDQSVAFLRSVAAFVAEIAAAGMANGLTQAALRCLCPGVPDLYQGCELWDFTLVDPDNRRPVDYERREMLLAHRDAEANSGAIKQALIRRLLTLRRAAPDLFAFGDWRALVVGRPDVFAFERRHAGQSLVAALALRAGRGPTGEAQLPVDLEGYDAVVGVGAGGLAEAFAQGPVAVWVRL